MDQDLHRDKNGLCNSKKFIILHTCYIRTDISGNDI